MNYYVMHNFSALSQNDPRVIGMSAAMGLAAVTLVMLAILFFVAVYIYKSIALQTIAKKTKTKNAWMAWLPLADIALVLNIARIDLKWLFALLLIFVPEIGWQLLCAGFAVAFAEIAKRLRKEYWVGIFMIVPVVNLYVLGYLAWSKN